MDLVAAMANSLRRIAKGGVVSRPQGVAVAHDSEKTFETELQIPSRSSKPAASAERINVSLKTLMQLASYAPAVALLQSSRTALQSGGYVSRFKGRGMEFDETRLYQPGDDIRSIDWRVTARSGKAHTKLYREERERPVFIAVDQRPAMQFATRGVFKAVQAAKLAALLAWAAQQNGDRIGGQVFSAAQCLELRPQNGRAAVLRLFEALLQAANPGNNPGLGFAQVLQRLAQHARPGSRVYVISDFRGMNAQAEEYFSKLARHCDVVLLLVFDPLESRLPARGRYRFTDGQNELEISTGDRQRLEQYQQRFLARVAKLENLAKKLRMSFLQCSTVDNPMQVLR
jgi:uncharacterized protein (DUF58 family)